MAQAGYYKRIRALCDKYSVLFVADEVLCGAGRTGKWLGLDHYPGVTPDIVTMGKGISGGYVPLSAVITGRKVLDVIAGGSGGLKHAQTFSHMPTICAVGLAALKYIEDRKLVERAGAMGEIFHQKIAALAAQPGVGDVRGLGLLAGVEFVADKDKKTPFKRSLKFAETFVLNAQDEGLVVWSNVGQADGENGDLVMLAPPFIISEAEIDELVTRFKKALSRTMDHLAVKGEIS